MLESTPPRMGSSFAATLASMPENDFLELVWENGQILMRDISGRTQKGHSCSRHSLYPCNGRNIHTKRARLGTSRDSQLYPSSSQNQASADSIIRPGLNSSKTQVSVSALHTSTLLQNDSQPDQNTGAVNFSNLRSPAALFKANSQRSDLTRPTYTTVLTRVEELKGGNDERPALGRSNRNPLETTMIEPASVSKSASGLPHQPHADLIPSVDYSEAFGHRNHKTGDQLVGQNTSSSAANTMTGKPNINKFTEPPVASSSVLSLGASNDPTYSLRRTYEDTEETAYPSEDFTRNVDEPQGLTKQGFARGATSAKRSRTSEVHNLSERKRRDEINKKMRALKELIPNCNKVDKASMLDEVIEYLKTLQLQLLIMSMGSGLCMPPVILPTMMQHMSAPHLTHFSPMAAGMGMGMSCNPGQLPITSGSGATFQTGITGTGFQMLGFPGHAFPMSVSQATFIPLVGMPSTQSVVVPPPGVPPLAEHLGSTPLTSSKDSNQQ